MDIVLQVLRVFLEIISIAIFLRAILSWVIQGQGNIITDILYHITEPIMDPLRRIIPQSGGMDFTPIIAIIILQVIIFFLP